MEPDSELDTIATAILLGARYETLRQWAVDRLGGNNPFTNSPDLPVTKATTYIRSNFDRSSYK